MAEVSTRATRMSLDISAGTPLIIFPKSSTSKDLLIANLGHMTLRNQFIFAGAEGTIPQGLSFEEEDDELAIINGWFVGVRTCILYFLKTRKNTFRVVDNTSTAFCLDKDSVSGLVEQQCLLDHMQIELVDIDLFSAVSISQEQDILSYKEQVWYLFIEKHSPGISIIPIRCNTRLYLTGKQAF